MVFKKLHIPWNKDKNKLLLLQLSGGRKKGEVCRRYCLYCGKFLGEQYVNAVRKRKFCNVSHEMSYHNTKCAWLDKRRKRQGDRVRNSSLKTRKKWSDAAKRQGLGGLISSKRFSYNGIILHSTYELSVAKDLDQNKIRWIRPKYFIWIDKNNSEHKYFPDFYLLDYDIYIDPKNDYLILKDSDKIERVSEQNNVNVLVLNKNQLTWKSIYALINSQVG